MGTLRAGAFEGMALLGRDKIRSRVQACKSNFKLVPLPRPSVLSIQTSSPASGGDPFPEARGCRNAALSTGQTGRTRECHPVRAGVGVTSPLRAPGVGSSEAWCGQCHGGLL